MADPIYTGTVGVPIRLTLLDDGVVHDPASATLLEITIVKPGGTKLVRTAPDVTLGTDSLNRPCLEYVTVAEDLAVAGVYVVQGYLEDAAGSWPAEPVRFRVHPSAR